MLPYWIMLLVPVLASVAPVRLDPTGQRVAWAAVVVFFTALIGFRFEVGGDWGTYQFNYEAISRTSFLGSLLYGDPGYYVLNWLSAQLGGGIVLVNTVCGAIVMIGLVRLLRNQPYAWLGLVAAVPYLVIVVAMGYTRQSVALGFVMLALADLEEQRMKRMFLWICLGILFHITAIVMLPIAALTASRQKAWILLSMTGVGACAVYFMLLDKLGPMWTNYVENQRESEGAVLRVAMNAVPALGFLLLKSRFRMTAPQERVWSGISLLALATIPLIPLASTAADRIALYFLPIQLVFFAHLSLIFPDVRARTLSVTAVVALYAAVQLVWLAGAAHAELWLPYRIAMPWTNG